MNPFQNIGGRRPQQSDFDLSHTRKFSFEPGRLYPILCAEALPSDKWDYSTNALVRMQPMLAPLMHVVDVYTQSFFYPERLTQQRGKFEVLITGGQAGDGKDAQGNTVQCPLFMVKGLGISSPTAFTVQEFFQPGSLADFLGIGFSDVDHLGDNPPEPINARPFIAFWRIWCEYFRDQNLDPDYATLHPAIFDSAGGNITTAIYNAVAGGFPFFSIPNVCWAKDMYTSALPFAQRGEPVETPLSGTGTVTYKNPANIIKTETTYAGALTGGTALNAPVVFTEETSGDNQFVGIDNIQEVALVSGGFTINALRTAARLQEWLEKMARGGARYIEQMKNIFNVTSSDARLQRAEYLGGGKIPMHISEVLQTSEDGTTPLAEMAGHGVTAGHVSNFRKFVEEHGFFFVFIYLRPKTAYQQGIPRMFTNRFDKLSYAWPQFAHLGEQEVFTKELYWTCEPIVDNDVFGYQQRYIEYKYIPSTVHGEFRTNLDFWHWGRIFSEQPALSPGFVHCDPDTRIFNVLAPATNSLYCIVNNKIKARRPLPFYAEPYL